MTVPDATILGAIGSLALATMWFAKRLTNSYFSDIKNIDACMSKLVDLEATTRTDVRDMKECILKIAEHENDNRADHERITLLLDEMVKVLYKMNGNQSTIKEHKKISGGVK